MKYYSGPKSKKFWDRVAVIKNRKLHDAIYLAACTLQDHEERVLKTLNDAETK